VAIRQTARGLQVVLRHECANSPAHRHGIVARTLTLFAQRTTAPESDHIIQFSATDSAPQAPALPVEQTAQSPAPDVFLQCEVRFLASRLTAILSGFPRPPPAASGLLLTVRSTVILV